MLLRLSVPLLIYSIFCGYAAIFPVVSIKFGASDCGIQGICSTRLLSFKLELTVIFLLQNVQQLDAQI